MKGSDVVGVVVAGLGIASDFTGLGEIWDGSVGLGIAGGTLIYDVYNAAIIKN